MSKSLTAANLLSNGLDADSASMLLKVKGEKLQLRTLCGLTHEETELHLSYKNLGPGDAMMLAPEIAVRKSLTSINLEGNELGPEGAKALAHAISVRAPVRYGPPVACTLWDPPSPQADGCIS